MIQLPLLLLLLLMMMMMMMASTPGSSWSRPTAAASGVDEQELL
jgi:hypothetical protein